MLALLTTLIAAPIGIRVAGTDDLAIASLVADGLQRSVDARVERDVIRLPNDPRCSENSERCVEQSRIDFGIDDVVLLSVYVGVTKHLAIGELFSPGAEPKKVTVALPKNATWDEPLAELAGKLFAAEGVDVASQPAFAPPGEAERSWWGPAMILTGAALIGVGAILGERAHHVREQLLSGSVNPDEFERLDRTHSDYRISAFTMIGVGGALAGVGLVFVLFDW